MSSLPSKTIHAKLQTDAKYPHLVSQLALQIRDGDWKAGERLPTFVQLQQSFGVTPHTVNRAMIALEHQGLVERRRGSGVYVSQQKPEDEKSAGTGIIGLCGFAFHHGGASSYWRDLIESIHRCVAQSKSQVLLLQGDIVEGWEKVDGVILMDWMEPRFQSRIPSQLPIVRLFATQHGRASVVADEYSGARLATQHLLELGHTKVAYLHGSDDVFVPQRLAGYCDALLEAGISPQPDWRRRLTQKNDYGPQFMQAGREAMAHWLKDKSRNGWKKLGCTALLCHNDETALGAMQSLSEAGLKVPHDVSVVGFDGTIVGEYSTPRLTSVEMPLSRMGELAVEMLQRQIAADEVVDEHISLSTQLLVRASTSAPSQL